MSEETVVADPQDKVVGAETPSQETTSATKVDETPQVQANDKVDVVEPKPQVQTTPRARPSEFYGMRKDMRFLKEAIAKRDQQIEEMAAFLKSQKSPDAVPSKFDKDKFFTDPETVLSAREKAYLDRLEAMDARIKSFEEGNQASARQRTEQEALEKLFPKTEGSSERLEERMEVQQERVDKLMKLLKDKPVLDAAFKLDPMGSIELIMEKLDAETPKSPTVLPKKLMGGAKGGSGASTSSPLDQKRAELNRMTAEVERDPTLRFDEKHKERRSTLMSELAQLLKEKGN